MAINPFWQNQFGVNSAMYGANPGPAVPPGLMADPQATGTGIFGASSDPVTQDAQTAAAAAFLAGSGWSPQRQSSSEIFGRALLAAKQARAASMNAIQKRQLADSQLELQKAQLKNLQNPTTDDIREFQYAKDNGYAGSFDQWMVMRKASGTTPAALQEWDYYNKLPPEDQKRFLELKRSQQTYALGEVAGTPGAFNRQTGGFNPLTTLPEQAQGKATVAGAEAAAKTTGTNQAGAQFDLPRVERTVNQALGDIEKLKNHPGLGAITGFASKIPIVPGTDQAAADALAKQIQGQTFLSAYQSLKGGGQITEVEGAKAEAAIGRLQRAQSTADYKAALNDLEDVLRSGLSQARRQTGATATAPPRNDAITMPDDITALVKKHAGK